jgi:hypothetical protein
VRRDHVHQPLDEQVTAVGGSYELVKEARIPLEGRDLLYVVGHAVFDTTCCGAGGCAYALVPGFVVRWRHRTTNDGLSVSEVEPVQDETVRRDAARRIRALETVQEVRFL